MPRPTPRFHDFVGHKQKIDYLKRQLTGAQARGEPFPHSLFVGPSGIGKTMLARALATEYGTRVIEAMGYDDRATLTRKLVDLSVGDFLFIDECHRLRPLDQELLCEATDSNSLPNIDLTRPDHGNADGRRIALQPWTLVLATDQPGVLANALHKRIVIDIHLGHYSSNELKEIVEVMATNLNMLITPQAARHVANIAEGLPRRAKQQLKNLRLYFPDAESRQLSLADVREFFEASGIDENGLTGPERRYLEVIAELGGASLESIALSLGTDADYVRRQIEPVLVRRGLAKITSAGRQITCPGKELMKGSAVPQPTSRREEPQR